MQNKLVIKWWTNIAENWLCNKIILIDRVMAGCSWNDQA